MFSHIIFPATKRFLKDNFNMYLRIFLSFQQPGKKVNFYTTKFYFNKMHTTKMFIKPSKLFINLNLKKKINRLTQQQYNKDPP